MKNKLKKTLKKIAVLFLLLGLCFTDINTVFAEKNKEETVSTENVIEITTEKQFLVFAEECKLDVFSLNKVIELKADLDFTDMEFSPVPYFNGVFHGNGHKISGITIKEKGSQLGVFRYIGELGKVSDLTVSVTIVPTGSQEDIGGIAGVNYGTIQNCKVHGSVFGVEGVGGIAGINKSTGQIFGCSSHALVMATNYTGGIAGINQGIVDQCINRGSINIEELETVLDLGGIDIGTMNFTQTIIIRNHMGGIVGSSNGVISECTNHGTVGYAHTGYNVGGIAGRQSGIIMECVNEGDIYGRKDVGGIVGQAEPYVESEYMSDVLEQTKSDIDRMTRTLNSLSNSLDSSAAEAKQYADALNVQYQGMMDGLSGKVSQMGDALVGMQEAEQCTRNIEQAMRNIKEIQTSGRIPTQEDIQEIERNMEVIKTNTERLEEMYAERDNVFENIEEPTEPDMSNAQGLTEALEKAMNTVTNGIDKLSSQAQTTINHLLDNTEVLRGEKELVVDISSIKTASILDGVISECQNHGMVDGDLNVGGIVGTMNIEYDDDPEEDFNVSEDTDVAISSEINDVIILSKNYGKVTGKKNYTGSIVGLQEFGYIYQCEGYGNVTASAGSYIGGIAGKSGGTIEKSYVMAELSGIDYIGGIVGEGASLKECLSVAKIDSEGERIGGIAGVLKDGGTVKENYFVKDGYDAIDDISYLGVAEEVTYEEIMAIEGAPEGFTYVMISFVLDGEVLKELTIPYGASLSEEDFPILEDEKDSYVLWPDVKEYTNIINNLVIEAEYIPWTQSVAADIFMDEKPVFIAVGDFYEETKIEIRPVEESLLAKDGENILYFHDWELISEYEKVFETVEGHFYIPEESRDSKLEVWTIKEGTWTAVETTWDGSYAVAEIPFEASFAVVEKEANQMGLYLTIAAVLFLLVILFLFVHNKRKQKMDGKKK